LEEEDLGEDFEGWEFGEGARTGGSSSTRHFVGFVRGDVMVEALRCCGVWKVREGGLGGG
jgi:hypothetical protein